MIVQWVFLISKHVHPFPKFEIRASSSLDSESCEDVTTDLRSLERHQKCLFHEPAKRENKCTYHNIFATLVDMGFTKPIIIEHKFRSGHRQRSIHGPHKRDHMIVQWCLLMFNDFSDFQACSSLSKVWDSSLLLSGFWILWGRHHWSKKLGTSSKVFVPWTCKERTQVHLS